MRADKRCSRSAISALTPSRNDITPSASATNFDSTRSTTTPIARTSVFDGTNLFIDPANVFLNQGNVLFDGTNVFLDQANVFDQAKVVSDRANVLPCGVLLRTLTSRGHPVGLPRGRGGSTRL